MDRTERRVAIAHRLADHAQRHEVVDLAELLALALHLLVDGPVVLGAPVDLEALEPHALELVRERLDGLRQVALAHLAALGHHARDTLIRLGLEVEEGEVLELPLDGAHAQAVGERRVHVHRLARLEEPAVLAQRRKRAHVVQAVGELHDDDADVARHGEEHLAEVERLLLVHAAHLDVGELRHAVHEPGNRLAEQARHVGERDLGVLDRVMQERRTDHVAIHVELGQNDGDLNGMVDIELSRATLLGRMLLRSEAVCVLDLRAILGAHVLAGELR